MDNFRRPGGVVLLTAPSGGVVSGALYKIGSLVVVAVADAAEDAEFEGAPKGVFDLPKPQQEAWAEGDKLYFDEALGLITEDDDSAANALVGVAPEVVPAAIVLSTDADGSDYDIVDNVFNIDDYTGLDGKTVTVTLTQRGRSQSISFKEGVDFTAATNEATTATNLAAAINAHPLLVASAMSADVTVTAAETILGAVRLDGVAR